MQKALLSLITLFTITALTAVAGTIHLEDLGTDFVPANGNQAGNALGDIVGHRLSTNQAAIRKADGTIIDLGTLGGPSSRATAINANGTAVVGWSDNGSGFQNSFRYADGTLTSILGNQPADNQAVGINPLSGNVIVNSQSSQGQGGDIFEWKLSDGSFSQLKGNAQARVGVNASGAYVGQLNAGTGFHQESDGTDTFISPSDFNPVGGVNDQNLVAGELLDSFAAFYFLGSPSAQAVPGISGLGATSLATGVSDTDLIYGDTDSTVFLYDFFEDSLTDLNTLSATGISDLQRLESIHGVAKGSDIFFGTYTDNNNQVGYYKAVIQVPEPTGLDLITFGAASAIKALVIGKDEDADEDEKEE